MTEYYVAGYTAEAYHTDKTCHKLTGKAEPRTKHYIEFKGLSLCKTCNKHDFEQKDNMSTKKCPFCKRNVGDLPHHLRAKCEKL